MRAAPRFGQWRLRSRASRAWRFSWAYDGMGATVCDGIVALARVAGTIRGHRAELNISGYPVEKLRQ